MCSTEFRSGERAGREVNISTGLHYPHGRVLITSISDILPVYGLRGGTITFTAKAPNSRVTSVVWKWNKDKVAECEIPEDETTFFSKFKNRTSLDKTTWSLTMSDLEPTLEGKYSVEINSKDATEYFMLNVLGELVLLIWMCLCVCLESAYVDQSECRMCDMNMHRVLFNSNSIQICFIYPCGSRTVQAIFIDCSFGLYGTTHNRLRSKHNLMKLLMIMIIVCFAVRKIQRVNYEG
uniref:Immunoglobulin V-set domain-containing protein n=1 Tax=Denticeps clupeoides TaxID=299321 RepID=A0AAY4C5N6_9TELE